MSRDKAAGTLYRERPNTRPSTRGKIFRINAQKLRDRNRGMHTAGTELILQKFNPETHNS